MKLNRLLAKHESMGRNRANVAIADGRVRVAGTVITNRDHEIDRFTAVSLDGAPVNHPERRLRILLYKPVGVVSATIDAEHKTVVDLIDDPDKHSLHLVGRLDRNTSGLMLLTNDGRWSKALMDPERKIPKTYLVETDVSIPPDAVAKFAAGFYFHTEDLTTRPAELVILTERTARVTIDEGRYHQIKRMFHRVGNRVVALHRESVGDYVLPEDLAPGEWRYLADDER